MLSSVLITKIYQFCFERFFLFLESSLAGVHHKFANWDPISSDQFKLAEDVNSHRISNKFDVSEANLSEDGPTFLFLNTIGNRSAYVCDVLPMHILGS